MKTLFQRDQRRVPEFCDGCSGVCDAHRRSTALRERAVERALMLGPRY